MSAPKHVAKRAFSLRDREIGLEGSAITRSNAER
jgi:hypothetical protein